MKLLKLAVVAAVATAFSAPAFADAPVNLAAVDDISVVNHTISVSGVAVVSGNINVNAETGALVDNDQASGANLVITVGGGNTATLNNSANGLVGNVGINMSSGTGNAQGNEAALSALQDASSVFASAATHSTQVSAVNANIAILTDNLATVTKSLTGADGNVGLNIATGSGNLQDNQLATGVRTGTAGGGSLARATGTNNQLVALTVNASLDLPVTNAAQIIDSIGGMGNIGVNMAAGYGNLQHNSLSIAAAR